MTTTKTAKTAPTGRTYTPESATPPWVDAVDRLATPMPPPPALVEGLIRRGERIVIGGASKSFKSWAALDLAVCVSQGIPWLDQPTEAAPAIFINLELPAWNVRQRIERIAAARLVTLNRGNLRVWNLRGLTREAGGVFDTLERHGKGLGLVVIDPAYKLFAGRDENSAGDVAEFLAGFDRITNDLEAAVVLPAHFAKGNAAGKEAMDRISGSGVFARDPDTILTLTRHEVADAYTVEATLRTFPPIDPFVIRWAFPVFQRDDSLDPAKLRQPIGRKRSFDDDGLLGLLADGPLTYSEWLSRAAATCGMSKRTFDNYRLRLTRARRVIKSATSDAYYLPNP